MSSSGHVEESGKATWMEVSSLATRPLDSLYVLAQARMAANATEKRNKLVFIQLGFTSRNKKQHIIACTAAIYADYTWERTHVITFHTVLLYPCGRFLLVRKIAVGVR